MTVELHFISHYTNGFHIIIHKLCYSTIVKTNSIATCSFHMDKFFPVYPYIKEKMFLPN